MSFVSRSKILHSNLPTEDVQSHLDEINIGMNFRGADRITINDLCPNEMAKIQMKDIMNLSLGNF